jgi:RNA polymerase sigma-70 factor (ECF subfamily)
MSYTLQTDEELFALVRDANDEQAFRALFRRYDKRLYAYCLRALGSTDDAKDAFQTIALTVFEKRAVFTDGSFAAWVFTIARNLCLKSLRQRKHNVEFTEEELGNHNDEPQHSDDFLLRAALRDSIGKLSEEFREVLEMRYFDELSYDEIAQILGIGESLAKIRVFRAKKQLQSMLSPLLSELQ